MKFPFAMVGFFLMVCMMTASGAETKIKGEEVEYSGGGITMKGYLAYDESSSKKRPGILVVHEWWGHNDYLRQRARMLAELGYTAMAVDMYGDGKQAEHPDDAGRFVGEVFSSMESAKGRFHAAVEILKAHQSVDPFRLAAIGYCFGGGVVVEMARRGADLRAVASFHGLPRGENPAQPGTIKAKILICTGDQDPMIPKEAIHKFEEEMTGAKADFQIITYPGARHSFTNPEADQYAKKFNLPLAYNKEADQKSWKDLQNFLKTVFEK